MKRTPERLDHLACEYVTGTLRGGARRRFERWLLETPQARRAVWEWEQRLGPMSALVPEETPPARVWRGIEARLFPEPAQTESKTSLAWLWRGWSFAASALVLVLAVMLFEKPAPSSDETLSGAVVQAQTDSPLWLVSQNTAAHRLNLRPVAATPAAPDRDYELWIVPAEGAPMSLGVIRTGAQALTVTLSDEALAALQESRTLAISLEPRGGSPSGAPTQVLHVAKLYAL